MKEYSQLIFNDFKNSLTGKHSTKCGYNVKFIGSGSFGKIYKILNKDQVVKVVSVFDKVESEIEIQHYLSQRSNYVLPILTIDECDGEYLIKMPLGMDVIYALESKYYDLNISNPYYETIKQLKFKWAREIALGLRDIHNSDILYLDLKLTNVILVPDESGVLKAMLSDFGLSQFMNENKIAVKGTLPYMSPVSVCDESQMSRQTDIWAYGMLLLELLFQFNLHKINNEDYVVDLMYELKNQGYTVEEIKETLDKAGGLIWLIGRLFEKVPKTLKRDMLKTKCGTLFKILPTSDTFDFTELIEPELLDFFADDYYTPKEYRQITEVIAACLTYPNNLTMDELIQNFSFFGMPELKEEPHYILQDIAEPEIDALELKPSIKKLTKIMFQRVKSTDGYKKYKKGVIELLINYAATVLGYDPPYEIHGSLEEAGIYLNKIFPHGVLAGGFAPPSPPYEG